MKTGETYGDVSSTLAPVVSLPVVARAAGVSLGVVQGWVKRGYLQRVPGYVQCRVFGGEVARFLAGEETGARRVAPRRSGEDHKRIYAALSKIHTPQRGDGLAEPPASTQGRPRNFQCPEG